MARPTRAVLILVLTGAVAAPLTWHLTQPTAEAVALAAATEADTPNPHHVFRTDGDGVWLHTVPSVQDGLVVVISEGAQFDVVCWTLGDDVLGNPVWLYGTSGGYTGYLTDYYVDTSWNTTDDLTAQGIPACDDGSSGEAPSVEQPANEVVLDLGPNPGVREQALADLVPEIEYAARAVGVDAQTLARLIYHEGGAYLNGTRAIAQAADDSGIHSSVGIAQVKVSTARQIDREVYGDTVMAEGTDEQVSDRLIYDLPYALRTAAGKLRLLMNQGITGRFGLFMTYNLTLDSARGWMEANYTYDPATLSALDIDRDVQLRRQDELNEAIAALE